MLGIEININGRVIARASARNLSNLAGVSDYDVRCISEPSSLTGAPRMTHMEKITGHDRNQSAWALVAKMAALFAEIENEEIGMTLEEGVAALRKVTRDHGGLNFSVEDWKAEREAEAAEIEKGSRDA